MNDTTLPTKRKAKKTGIRKGFALYDWKMLLNSSRDLAMKKGAPLRSISMEEVSLHNKVHDGWMVLHGKVYNIGPYLHYHPGGIDILKSSLGKDGTALFERYHRWVGIENLIGKLLLGYVNVKEENKSQMSMLPPKPRGRKLESLLKNEDSSADEDEQDTAIMEKNS
jgi:cytochrome-b5 reductase